MRTYIQPLKKSVEDEIKVRLDHEVAQGLKDYCEFLQSPQDYVITQALQMIFRKDKDFAEWLRARSEVPTGPAAGPEAESLKAKKTSGA